MKFLEKITLIIEAKLNLENIILKNLLLNESNKFIRDKEYIKKYVKPLFYIQNSEKNVSIILKNLFSLQILRYIISNFR